MNDRIDLDDLDRRLQQAGDAWRATVPTYGDPTRAAAAGHGRPGWLVPVVAAAAATALVVGGAATLSRLGGDAEPPPGTSSPTTSSTPAPGTPRPEAVPFVELAAAGVAQPRRDQVWTPDPGAADGLPACDSKDLRYSQSLNTQPSRYFRSGLFVTISLADDTPCQLASQPTVALTPTGGGAAATLEPARLRRYHWSFPVRLARGEPAELVIRAYDRWCSDADELRLTWPGQRPTVVASDFGFFDCRSDWFAVYPVAPQHADVRTFPRFGGLDVVASGPAEVTLTATDHDISLAACPDWSLTSAGGAAVSFQLNCAAVPSVWADGTPYLPVGTAVRFALPASKDPGGRPRVWQLLAGDLPSVELPAAE